MPMNWKKLTEPVVHKTGEIVIVLSRIQGKAASWVSNYGVAHGIPQGVSVKFLHTAEQALPFPKDTKVFAIQDYHTTPYWQDEVNERVRVRFPNFKWVDLR